MADAEYDVLILGAGSGGYACALRAAQLGLSVGLVEKGNLGGTCLHVGCIPTKALLHAAEVADSARESEKFGVQASFEGIDMAGVNAYKDAVVSRLFKGLSGLRKARGITLIEGDGRLTGPREVTVGDAAYTGRHVVLASGSYSRTLPGIEIDGERILTSEHALAPGFGPGLWRCRGPFSGVFDRTLVVPMQIDPDGIKAEYNNGLLAIFIPRAERDKPRTIEIR